MEKNKILIFIYSLQDIPRLKEIIRSGRNNIVAVFDSGVDIEKIPAELKNSIVCRSFQDYKKQEHNATICAEEALQLIEKWGNLKVGQDRSFEDLSRYQEIPLWKVHDNTTLQYFLTDLVYYVKVIRAVLEEEKPDRIILTGSKYALLERVFYEVSCQRNIPVQWVRAHRTLGVGLAFLPIVLERSRFLRDWEFRICIPLEPYILALSMKNIILGFWGKIHNASARLQEIGSDKKILFHSTNKKQLDTVIPLVREFQKETKNKVLVIDWHWRSGDAIGLLKKEDIPHKVFDGYRTLSISASLWRKSRYFLSKWRLIEKNAGLKRQFQYDNIFLWNLLHLYLKELFLRHFVRMAIFFEVAKRIADSELPSILVVTNEREWTARLSVIAARLRGIPSIGLQRGAIADFADWQGPLYTDKIVVDGEFAKRILVKRGVAAESVIIAGNPRYDIIRHIDIPSTTEKVYARLGVRRDKKLIVLTTTFVNPHHSLADKRRLLRLAYGGVKKFPSCHLVVKLHPAEASDLLHREIAQEIGIDNISILKDANMLELIASCHTLVTGQSTTGIEAILMDKPLICVSLSRIQAVLIPFVESRAAVGVYREEDFAAALKKVMEDREVQESLRAAREKFIPFHAYKIDGKAAERVAAIINGMIQERERG